MESLILGGNCLLNIPHSNQPVRSRVFSRITCLIRIFLKNSTFEDEYSAKYFFRKPDLEASLSHQNFQKINMSQQQ